MHRSRLRCRTSGVRCCGLRHSGRDGRPSFFPAASGRVARVANRSVCSLRSSGSFRGRAPARHSWSDRFARREPRYSLAASGCPARLVKGALLGRNLRKSRPCPRRVAGSRHAHRSLYCRGFLGFRFPTGFRKWRFPSGVNWRLLQFAMIPVIDLAQAQRNQHRRGVRRRAQHNPLSEDFPRQIFR